MAYYRNIGLIGRAQVGKDTVAARLGQRYGYQRVAFADKLKVAALTLNPLVPNGFGGHVRISSFIDDIGWDEAKTTYPEVRRILQHVGQSVREIDPGFWVTAALPAITAAGNLGLPVVVTDVRYLNEAKTLREWGFHLIRVTRPVAALAGEAGRHPSETELDTWDADLTIGNYGTLPDLNSMVDGLLLPRA